MAYITQVTHSLYESSELNTLTKTNHKVTQVHFKSVIGIMIQGKNIIIILSLLYYLYLLFFMHPKLIFQNNYFCIKFN